MFAPRSIAQIDLPWGKKPQQDRVQEWILFRIAQRVRLLENSSKMVKHLYNTHTHTHTNSLGSMSWVLWRKIVLALFLIYSFVNGLIHRFNDGNLKLCMTDYKNYTLTDYSRSYHVFIGMFCSVIQCWLESIARYASRLLWHCGHWLRLIPPVLVVWFLMGWQH